tara:strand:+ start:652 stop:825 length:174 start_codon:yes stop_codon:yes gene_type:complete
MERTKEELIRDCHRLRLLSCDLWSQLQNVRKSIGLKPEPIPDDVNIVPDDEVEQEGY